MNTARNSLLKYSSFLLFISILLLSGCGKDDDPIVTFTDSRDGQTYKIVTIGDQVWMAENMNFEPTTGESWCYDDVQGLCDIRGQLYDYDAATFACPDGWHLPSNSEWNQLSTTLGGDLVSGGKLKAEGFDHWYPPNIGATNESGFSAQPFGRRRSVAFEHYGETGYWWTSSFIGIPGLYFGVKLKYSDDEFSTNDYHEGNGLSVRCVMD